MLNKIKQKMGKRGTAVLKLTLWAGIVTWMLFYLAFGLVMAAKSTILDFGSGTLANILAVVFPVWIIFTVLLTIVYIARMVSKKFGKKKDKEEEC